MRDIVITCCMLKVCTSQNRMILLLLVRPYVTHCVYKCVLDTVRLHSFSSFRGGKEKKTCQEEMEGSFVSHLSPTETSRIGVLLFPSVLFAKEKCGSLVPEILSNSFFSRCHKPFPVCLVNHILEMQSVPLYHYLFVV